MSQESVQARAIFIDAVENVPPEHWREYVDEACGDDATLREKVQRLLDAHGEIGSFMDKPAAAPVATIDQPITEKPGTQIGPYKLLQQIGEGGMGVVYMAEQKEPVKRRVALKIIKPGMDTRQVIARFEAERQALAMMDHPNIAKVLDAGATESGRPYFVMELVNGISITQYCDEQHLTPKERLKLFVPICQAIQHAHQKGIIHRDLKPSNILVAEYDHQAVPKVIDFGVAKAMTQTLTEKTMFTQLGQIIGTLEYMSPEQAKRNQLDVDTRSDIYSLGVLLYELLTGDTPFDRRRLRSAAFEEMLRIIREEEPSKPSTKVSSSQSLPSIAANRRIEPAKLGSTIRGELDWIVMKALEKDRARRYETASKFAEDVQHFLNDEPVAACPPSAAYRIRKFARRHKGALIAAAVVTAALLSGVVGVTTYALQQRELANQRANLVREREQARNETASRLYDALLRQSAALRESRRTGYRSEVLKSLHEAVALDVPATDFDEIRDQVLACLGDPVGMAPIKNPSNARVSAPVPPDALKKYLPPPFRTFRGEIRARWAMTLDGASLAVVRGDGVALYDAEGTSLGSAKSMLGPPTNLAFSADGRFLAAGCDEGAIVWTVPGLKVRTFFRGTSLVRSVALSPSGALLATQSNATEIWSLASNRLLFSLESQGDRKLEFSADGELLLGIHEGEAKVGWNVNSTPEKRLARGHQGPVTGVVFSPDGRSLASSSSDGTFRIWNAETGRALHVCGSHAAKGVGVAYHPDGTLLASGEHGNTPIRIWDPQTGEQLAQAGNVSVRDPENSNRLVAVPGAVWEFAFDPSGKYLLATGDGGAAAWTIQRDSQKVRLEHFATIPLSTCRRMTIHPSGLEVVLGNDRGIYRYDLLRADGPHPLQVPGNGLKGFQFYEGGKYMTFTTSEDVLGIWDWSKAAVSRVTQTRVWAGRHAITNDGRWAVMQDGSWRGSIVDLDTEEKVLSLPPETASIWNIARTRDGRRLALGTTDGTVAIWDLKEVRSLLADFNISIPAAVSRTANEVGAPNAPQLLRDAREHLGSGELEAAIELLSQGVERFPHSIEFRALRGEAYARQKRWPEASADLTAVAWLRPTDAETLHRYLSLLAAGGQAADFAATLPLGNDHPEHVAGLRRFSFELKEKGDSDTFQQVCTALFAKHRGTADGDVARDLCRVLKVSGVALHDWDRVIKLGELATQSTWWKNTHQSALLYRAGRLEEAVTMRQQVIQDRGGEPNVWDCYCLAMAHHGLGNAADAQTWLSRAEELMPAEPTLEQRLNLREAQTLINEETSVTMDDEPEPG